MYKIEIVKNLADMVKAVNDFTGNDKSTKLWFRGHSNHNYHLTPTLYRKVSSIVTGKEDEWEKLREKENQITTDFMSKNYNEGYQRPDNRLQWLANLQHYKAPTRILDWTETLFTAILFSLKNLNTSTDTVIKNIPCVWCLNPKALINKLQPYYPRDIQKDKIPNLLDISLRSRPFLSKFFLEKSNYKTCFPRYYPRIELPLPVYFPYTNERIRAQAGTFTIFPRISSKIDSKLENYKLDQSLEPDIDKILRKILIVKPYKMREEMDNVGFDHTRIFPELDAVGAEIERRHFSD